VAGPERSVQGRAGGAVAAEIVRLNLIYADAMIAATAVPAV
jgi:hypothetical protein